jgi:hypothetical protein
MKSPINQIQNIENTITEVASTLNININNFIKNGQFDTDGFIKHAKELSEGLKTA